MKKIKLIQKTFAGLMLIFVCFLTIQIWNFSANAQKQNKFVKEDSIPILPFNTLQDFITNVKSRLPRAGSEGFVKPKASEQAIFSQAVDALLRGDLTNADMLASAANYSLVQLYDQTTNRTYLVLLERATNFRALGTYVFNVNFGRNLILEVPHPLFDVNTLEEGAQIFQQTNARGLFISGSHRCANAEQSPCSGTTTACDGVSRPFRVSDAAHFTGNYFQAAHQAVLNPNPKPIVVSLHGNAVTSLPDIVLSNGTDVKDGFSSLVNRLRRQLKNRNASVGSCNYVGDRKYSLCGTTNVQGRFSNGVGNACAVAALGSSGLFLHIEQHLNIRNDPAVLIEALNAVIPLN
jgi:hypothetical protein